MGRNVVFLILGLGIAAGAVFFLLDSGGEDDPYASGPMADSGDPADETEDGATLQGTGIESEDSLTATAESGRQHVEGHVYDPDGNPAKDVRVSVHFTSPAWNDAEGSAKYNSPVATMARDKQSILSPRVDFRPSIGETTTDAKGRFRIEGLKYGSFQVRAHVEAPLLSPYASATISPNWGTGPLTIHLRKGTPLRGKVLDANDKPIGAVITARATLTESMMGGGGWLSKPTRNEAATGAFEFAAVPEGTLRFTVTVPGKFLVNGLTAEAPTDEEVILRLPAIGGQLSGIVTNQDGQGVADAFVNLSVDGGKGVNVSVHATTSADGSYAFSAIPTGELKSAKVTAVGYAIHHGFPPLALWTGLAISKAAQSLDFVLLKGGTVKGKVSSSTGEPLAGATVYVFAASAALGYTAGTPLQASSNALGQYEVSGVPAGRLIVVATHPTHYIEALAKSATGSNMINGMVYTMPGQGPAPASPAPFTLVMPINGSTLTKDLTMDPGLPITGAVEDPAGSPVADALIKVRNLNLQQTLQRWGVQWWADISAEIRSNQDGTFEIASLPPGDAWELFAKKEGYAGQYSEPVTLAKGEPAPEVTLKLKAGATVRGTIVSEDGEGYAGARVQVWGNQSALAGGNIYTSSGPNGEFEITGLPAGDYQAWVHAGTMQMISNNEQRKISDLKDGEVREGLEYTIASSAFAVEGRLVDEAGEPVSGISIQLQANNSWAHGNSGSDGKFKISTSKEGKGTLWLQRNGQSNKKLGEVEIPSTGNEFTVPKPETTVIEGMILDIDGNPVPLALLTIRGKGGSRSNRGWPSMPGQQGGNEVVFGKFRRVVKGKPPFSISVRSARDATGQPMNLAPYSDKLEKAPDKPIEIKMEAGKEVTGVVVDGTGTGVEGVKISAGGVSDTSDEQGKFTLAGLGDSVNLQINAPKGYVKPKNQKASAGDHVRIELTAGLSVVGKVFDPEGGALKGGWVNAHWRAGSGAPSGNANTQVKSSGKFTLEGIPESALVQITVNAPWEAGSQRYAPQVLKDVRPGTTDLEVHMVESVTVTGKVIDTSGDPVTSGWVFAKTKDGQHSGSMQQIKKDGTFKISGLKAGEYDIGVQQRGGGPSPKTVRVTAPTSGVVIQLPKTQTITGRLEGGDTSGYRITARRAAGTGSGSTLRGSIKGDGTFTLNNVPEDGTWVVLAMKRGAEMYAESAPVQAGATGITMKLRKGLTISGRVTTGGAAPADRLWVMCRQDNGFQTWTRTEEDGTFEVKGLPSGTYKLRTLQSGAPMSTDNDLEVDAGATGVSIEI